MLIHYKHWSRMLVTHKNKLVLLQISAAWQAHSTANQGTRPCAVELGFHKETCSRNAAGFREALNVNAISERVDNLTSFSYKTSV